MDTIDRNTLLSVLESLRKRLEQAFRTDTAAEGFHGSALSTGHCAAVAAVVHELLGGDLVSAPVRGHSHWLNRITVDDTALDIDLTGDQFGRAPVQVEQAGQLYGNVRVRQHAELDNETLLRGRLLAERADIAEAVRAIDAALTRRCAPTSNASTQVRTSR